MSSEDPSLLFVCEFLERILVSTRGRSCTASGTPWGLHTNSTDDRSSSYTGPTRTGTMGADINARRVNWDGPRWDVGYGRSAVLSSEGSDVRRA